MDSFDVSTQRQTASLLAEVLMVEQLAQLIHKSPSSIRSDASRNPHALPPICRLPGNKRLLWLRTDVMSWLASYVQRESLVAVPVEVLSPRRPGRPRKVGL
jgi:hypothetical protein